ncbi:glucan 1,3-beta-glucosidase-like [Phoenix dactylifera]|uniref:Glucan 1,3-beta-glucosidase-like n=1 Tax=Phoenix dactylifera TaxID=42345 RepID=A0A8B9ACQ0_PHODC|nr:glucan 1,3-beta-glucosidase-like [Phoenix dactylifera]
MGESGTSSGDDQAGSDVVCGGPRSSKAADFVHPVYHRKGAGCTPKELGGSIHLLAGDWLNVDGPLFAVDLHDLALSAFVSAAHDLDLVVLVDGDRLTDFISSLLLSAAQDSKPLYILLHQKTLQAERERERERVVAVPHLLKWLPILLVLSCHFSFSSAARATPSFPIKAVNLGGWLVTEGWIKPSLFDGIPINNDLLDGTHLQFESVTQQMYLSAEDGGGTIIVANRTSASGWETFTLWRITESTFQFKVFDKQFVGLSSQGDGVVAVSTDPGQSETLEIVRNNDDPNRVRIKAPNGFFIQAKTDVLVTADYPGSTSWGDDDPSVFRMTIVATPKLQGEYQVTNGYGPEKAPQVMKEHWSSFIVEDDFSFISQNGLNAVRIPVGWWIASDPNPPKPFVGGSLQALDNAFAWAGKYNIKVIVDLHAAPGSQNGDAHSGTRDGSQEWGQNDSYIDQTVAVIDFLTARYAKDSSLLAIELINEPRAPGVTLDSLKKYYQAGYNTVRKYTSDAYVIMSNRLSADPTELLGFASGFQGSVIDVHYYNLFSNQFNGSTVQQNIDYINNNRAKDLATITRSNGPLTFVGEWVAEWEVKGATKEDYQRFAQAQLNVYGQATFGWAYWTLKNVEDHWSLEWMIKNGSITL